MFQNIQKDIKQNEYEKEQTKLKKPIKEILKDLFSINNIALFVIAFMVSMVGFQQNSIILSISPFGISFLAACLSNNKSIGVIYLLTLIGTFISFGANSLLIYFLTTLVFFVFVLIKRPKKIQNVNEQSKVGVHLFLAVLVTQIVPMFFRTFYIYDLLTSIMLSILSYVFYKIFANSILMLQNIGTKKAFSIEEVIGTSLLIAISVCAFRNFSIFGYSVKNILSILVVLILGWKNGMLVGAAGGITIGVVLGVIENSNPVMLAAYAVSGMLARSIL